MFSGLCQMLRNRWRQLFLAVLALVPACSAFAHPPISPTSTIEALEPELERIQKMSIEELLGYRIAIASTIPKTPRETPGVISLITRDELLDAGCRDLLDALTLFVPGFHAGHQMQGVVGPGFRGLWALEGKIQLLVDGIEFNEEESGTIVFGNHFPIATIERVEVIRGPGSAMYGGYAGLAVINIITRNAARSSFLAYHGSEMKKSPSHRNLSFGFGRTFPGSELSVTGTIGRGSRSDRNNLDYYGTRMPMGENTRLDPQNLNVHYSCNGFDFRALAENYHMTEITLWGENHFEGPIPQDFNARIFQLKYDYRPNTRLTVTPRILRKIEYPWMTTISDYYDPAFNYANNKRVERDLYGVIAKLDCGPRLNYLFGVELSENRLIQPDEPGPYEEPFLEGNRQSVLDSKSLFGEVMKTFSFGSITLGARYDTFERLGNSFVPRFVFNKTWDKAHMKLMFSRSYRAPMGIIPNKTVPGAYDLHSEEADNKEVEFGYRFSDRTFAAVNFFDIRFDKIIVYRGDDTQMGRYYNGGAMGTRGAEFELRHLRNTFRSHLTYAFYKASANEVDIYQNPANSDAFLGFAQQRCTALIGWKVAPRSWLNLSGIYDGKRYGYDYADVQPDAAGNPIITDHLKSFAPQTILNLNLRNSDVLMKGLHFDIGIANLTDAHLDYLPPMFSRIAPLPGPSRALTCRLEYERSY